MKSVIKHKSDELPMLMQYDVDDKDRRFIVMMLETKELGYNFSGFVVQASKNTLRFLGEFSELWVTDYFKPFNGEVTLSND